jgi:hypothetical protein
LQRPFQPRFVPMADGGRLGSPPERASMRGVREILRLKYECGVSSRAIAVGSRRRRTVGPCLKRVAAADPAIAAVTDRSGFGGAYDRACRRLQDEYCTPRRLDRA